MNITNFYLESTSNSFKDLNLNYVLKNLEAGRNHEVLTAEVFPLDCSLPAEAFQYLKIWATLLDTTRLP